MSAAAALWLVSAAALTVATALDGDSLACAQGPRVRLSTPDPASPGRGPRLFGIDAPEPEMNAPAFIGGREAREWLAQLLEGQTVLCRQAPGLPTDQQPGEIAATCYLPGPDIAEMALDVELAAACPALGGIAGWYAEIDPRTVARPGWCDGRHLPRPAPRPGDEL